MSNNVGSTESNKHHRDRTRHSPHQMALASSAILCVFGYSHYLDAEVGGPDSRAELKLSVGSPVSTDCLGAKHERQAGSTLSGFAHRQSAEQN